MSFNFTYGELNYTPASLFECGVASPAHSNLEGLVIIPSLVIDSKTGKRYRVTRIESYAFKYFTKINATSLPNTLQYIGWDAFYGTAISHLIIPQSVTDLSGAAFSNMWSLISIIFEPGIKLKRIPGAVFSDCKSLYEVLIPPSVESFGQFPFRYLKQTINIYLCGSHYTYPETIMSETNVTLIPYVTKKFQDENFASMDVAQMDRDLCSVYDNYFVRKCSVKETEISFFSFFLKFNFIFFVK